MVLLILLDTLEIALDMATVFWVETCDVLCEVTKTTVHGVFELHTH